MTNFYVIFVGGHNYGAPAPPARRLVYMGVKRRYNEN